MNDKLVSVLSVLFFSVLFPILLAWFFYKLPTWRDTRIYSRKKGLLGTWLSTWQEADDPRRWVTEKVEISAHKGKLQLVNFDNSGGHAWRGECLLHDERYLYGTWRSSKPGAQSAGVFSFLALPQGKILVGQAIGQDPAGVPRASDWILGRQPEDVEQGKQWLIKYATHFHGDA